MDGNNRPVALLNLLLPKGNSSNERNIKVSLNHFGWILPEWGLFRKLDAPLSSAAALPHDPERLYTQTENLHETARTPNSMEVKFEECSAPSAPRGEEDTERFSRIRACFGKVSMEMELIGSLRKMGQIVI